MNDSRICLDTSAYSAFMRGREGPVRAVREAEEIVLTPVVLGELLASFRAGRREAENRHELERFRASPRVRFEQVDDGTAERYAEILTHLRRAGTPIPTNDIWIAASAMQRGLVVHTTDPHFDRVPQVLKVVHPV
ncbi:MAG TPA: type II toxin-antitoxin system VapC family toxin [Longimicrobiales bacterium]|nr:type II toxin-antitoxin system VapC family toxin [Longimicrobiales bacterium]